MIAPWSLINAGNGAYCNMADVYTALVDIAVTASGDPAKSV
jgi:hypothetical protein